MTNKKKIVEMIKKTLNESAFQTELEKLEQLLKGKKFKISSDYDNWEPFTATNITWNPERGYFQIHTSEKVFILMDRTAAEQLFKTKKTTAIYQKGTGGILYLKIV
jgi:hypothetical protein